MPVVCTHALRGCNASFAIEAGATSEAVARSLGHGSFEVTKRHYAKADAIGNAQNAALASVLTRPALAETLADVSASELLELLPGDVLAELVPLYLARSARLPSVPASTLTKSKQLYQRATRLATAKR